MRSGFTLMESIATIVILAILGSIASFLVVDAVDGYVSASGSAQLHAEASLAMDRIMRELRKIELDPDHVPPPDVAPHIDAVPANSSTWDETPPHPPPRPRVPPDNPPARPRAERRRR